jgi:hypothetical protein
MRNMKKPWVKTIRRPTGLVEHICKHGCGHPAYGSVHWLKIHKKKGLGIHGCDGCCRDSKWILADLKDGVEIANKLLKIAITKIHKLGGFFPYKEKNAPTRI